MAQTLGRDVGMSSSSFTRAVQRLATSIMAPHPRAFLTHEATNVIDTQCIPSEAYQSYLPTYRTWV